MKISMLKSVKEVCSYYGAKYNLDASTFGTTFAFMLLALVVLSPDHASATVTAATGHATGVAQVICNIVNELQGPVAKGVAAFGIIFLGFSLFLGKISWGVALALGIGIAAIFGAEQIVGIMVGTSDSDCPTT